MARDTDIGGITMGTQPESDKAYDKLKSKQENSVKAKSVLRGAGYARGGGVSPERKKHPDEKEDKALIKKELGKAKIKPAKHGGKIDGGKPKVRADKYARGGSVPRGHTKININMGASQADKKEAMQKGVQLGAQLAARKMGGGGMRPGAGAPMQARPPMPAGPPPAPGGMPPGAGGPPGVPPTMGAACGGRQYAKGGKVKGVQHLTGGAGAGGGKGRLAKMASYGTKPKA